ncbi:hypothetical protein C8R45DRAFT_826566, partial [Mycena sanguinolenta]
CKLPAGGVRRYQTNADNTPAKDRSSTSTLLKHANKCWGKAVVTSRMKGAAAQPKDGSIHAAFARQDERPADREFKSILGAGRPEFNLPGRRTVSRDLNVSFTASHRFVQQLLQARNEYPGRLSFATDAWTSPNQRAFLAWTVHLHHEECLLSFPLDVFEVPEVRVISPVFFCCVNYIFSLTLAMFSPVSLMTC